MQSQDVAYTVLFRRAMRASDVYFCYMADAEQSLICEMRGDMNKREKGMFINERRGELDSDPFFKP